MKIKTLPETLVRLRRQAHLTQQNVADYLHIVRQAYSHYEQGRRTPDLYTLQKIAQLYHTTIDEILRSEETETNEDM